MHDDTPPRPDLNPAETHSAVAPPAGLRASEKLPLELLRARRRELLAELRDVDGKIRGLEEKSEQPPQRERVAMHVTEVLEDQEKASASDLVRAVLRRDNRLHAGTVRAYISSLRRDGRLRAVGGRGVPGDPLVLALPEKAQSAPAASPIATAAPVQKESTEPDSAVVTTSALAASAK